MSKWRHFSLYPSDTAHVEKLGAPLRAALHSVDADGKSYTDAAAHLGIPLNTLRTRLFRARNIVVELRERAKSA